MAVGFSVDMFFYEAGHPDFLHSFFSTVSYHCEPDGWGTKYPLLMQDLYFERLKWQDVSAALKNVEEIREKLSKLPPSEVIWDFEDITKKPPYGDKIPAKITNLANYHTIQGTSFLDLLKNALKESEECKMDVTIEKVGR
ncbi:Imm70 family immunity protein [Bacillus sp. 166amftsu]|uniref:Imm70 family immunity protein n=1 Tax=Bacillus sp. 166amftsu TaxID=1761753 RepID=UPI00089A0AE5|nr:Imm70 family immunity protein [Bacillus sp. 166amftsu]SDY39700.1 Immunity protein 70 [Bacillus sp. 166amftsu]